MSRLCLLHVLRATVRRGRGAAGRQTRRRTGPKVRMPVQFLCHLTLILTGLRLQPFSVFTVYKRLYPFTVSVCLRLVRKLGVNVYYTVNTQFLDLLYYLHRCLRRRSQCCMLRDIEHLQSWGRL